MESGPPSLEVVGEDRDGGLKSSIEERVLAKEVGKQAGSVLLKDLGPQLKRFYQLFT